MGLPGKPWLSRQAEADQERAELFRDAAISLLLETPAECQRKFPTHSWTRCGTCWTCRVDKFLRDVGARR